MAVTFPISAATAHAIAFIKAPSTYASSEELRFANTIESIVTSFHRWHWNIAAGTDIAVTAGTQTLTMAAANQDKVQFIVQANLLDGSTQQPELHDYSDMPVPLITTQGEPFAFSLINSTQIRLYPTPDATYTFQWRYYKRPTFHTANTEAFDVPDAFLDVVKAGMIWQILAYRDDLRAPEWEKKFNELLINRRRVEMMAMGRSNV